MAVEINSILSRLQQGAGTEGFGKTRKLNFGNEEGREGATFADMVKNAVNSVDQAQKTADQSVQDVITGKSENIHEVMISMEKAQLSFQLMLEVRNRAVETYQELSRMQI